MKLKHCSGVSRYLCLRGAPVLVLYLLIAPGGATASASVSTPAAPVPTATARPVVDLAKSLAGSALLEALQQGGLVLYVRHTETGTISKSCDTSNLSARGEQTARDLAAWLRKFRLPISRVLSSPVCRVFDTARLLDAGKIELTEDLINISTRAGFQIHEARMQLLAAVPATGSNTLLVSHFHEGDRIEQTIHLEFGETIVFRPDGRGGSDAIARVRLEDWARLEAGVATTR